MARFNVSPIVLYAIILLLLMALPLMLWRLLTPQGMVLTGPTTTYLNQPLAPGLAEAGFTLSSPGGSMTPQSAAVDLLLWVAHGDTYRTQAVASCNEAGMGNALDSLSGIALAAADCDGNPYWLIAEGGRLLVQQGDVRQRDRIVTTLDLPPGTMRVSSR